MMRELLFEITGDTAEIALLQDRKLWDYRRMDVSGIRAEQVYLARVERIAKGMNAAFVLLDRENHGFLPLSEAKTPLRGGMEVLAQVKKPPLPGKAAYLTQDISLAGRYLIYLPFSHKVSVSSRVEDEAEKQQLLERGKRLCEGHGLIMRRESVNASDEALMSELSLLTERFRLMEEKQSAVHAPSLLWEGRDIVSQAAEDFPLPGQVTGNQDLSFLSGTELANVPYRQSEHPFSLLSVREQLRKLCARRVWLPSGGFLVVDLLEALTVIDVNTGKDVGQGDDRENVFVKTNLEAVQMIARILRVRALGGIVIIDLIDMEQEEHQKAVLRELENAVRDDPVKCVVHGMTTLGLVEMTRKKTAAPLRMKECPHCHGSGLVNTEDD